MKNKIQLIIGIAGIVEILVGLLHFAMPHFLYLSNGFIKLSPIESDYLLLVTYAVGILLIAFGATTLLFSNKIEELKEILYYYLFIQLILWIVRVIMEVIYPLGLDMFYVQPFTLVVFPGLVIELLLFIVATILVKQEIDKER